MKCSRKIFNLVGASVALTLFAATCTSHAMTFKFVREVAIIFAPMETKLSPGNIEKLQNLSYAGSAQCLPSSKGSVVVAVESLVVDNISSQDRLLAETRAREVKNWLVHLGFSERVVYDGITSLDEMINRKAGVSSLVKEGLNSNTVVVELVCDPAN